MKCIECGQEVNPQDTSCPSCQTSLSSPKTEFGNIPAQGCAEIAISGCLNFGCSFVFLFCMVELSLAGTLLPLRVPKLNCRTNQMPAISSVEQSNLQSGAE